MMQILYVFKRRIFAVWIIPSYIPPQYLTPYHSTFKTKARGLIHNRVAFQMHRILKDPKGRYIILVCTINSRIYTLVSIYAPNAAQSQFLSQVLQKVTDIQSGTLVICGDLNMGLTSLKRPFVVTCSQHVTSSQRFRQLLHRYNLYDAWLLLHPTERDYTFRSRVHNSYSRIDYFLISGSALPYTIDCTILPLTWSDHSPVILTLGDAYQTYTRPPWRLRDNLLLHEPARIAIQAALDNYFKENVTPDVNRLTIWQAHKAVITGECIKWATHFRKQYISRRLDLLTKLQDLDTRNKTAPSQEITDP
uniref:exodeoxyribonuclease III n=1 Tax=Leptobrachium leishanense TaxID=445787 RepID=A0A8C5QAG1_9ANUR